MIWRHSSTPFRNHMAKIFLISGPSGVGEDSLIEKLQERIPIQRVITTVTRKMRPGEKQGSPYFFVSKKRFQEMIKNNELIEWAVVYNSYRGCTKKEIQRLMKKKDPIVWKVDWQGVRHIKKIFPAAVAIFIIPPSYKTLVKRILKRDKDAKRIIQEREAFTKEWLKQRDLYDWVVVNREGKLKQAVDEVEKIIRHSLSSNHR